jgi:A/G-specific adenine glycosylase
MEKENKYTLIRAELKAWHQTNGNDYPWRSSTDLYTILITEILLQKTIAINVYKIYTSFFTKYKDFSTLYYAEIVELQSLIKPLGLSNKRAKTLKDLANYIVKEQKGTIPKDITELKEIKGIADYVINALLCFGLNERVLFYDVNIRRFIGRVFEGTNQKISYELIAENLDKLLPEQDCKYIYWAILDLCNKICRNNRPKCEECPLSINCAFYTND